MKWIFIGILAILFIASLIQRYRVLTFSKRFLAAFSFSKLTEQYDAAAPQYFFPEKKYAEAVLFIHGFSTCCQDFEFLFKELRGKQIPYQGVTLTGYGLTTFKFLKIITINDWIREVITAYDSLSTHAQKIHVVGNSFGALLGALLAMHRPVDKFIAISPAFCLHRFARIAIKLLNTPVIKNILGFFIPYYNKKQLSNRPGLMDIMDPIMSRETFQFPVVPSNVLATFDQAYKMLDFRKLKILTFYLFIATKDQVIDIKKTHKILQKYGIHYKEFQYHNSAHVVTRDVEREQVAKDFLSVIEA